MYVLVVGSNVKMAGLTKLVVYQAEAALWIQRSPTLAGWWIYG
ncbi:hypothetical protein [Pantanalinema sp. GBBB05]